MCVGGLCVCVCVCVCVWEGVGKCELVCVWVGWVSYRGIATHTTTGMCHHNTHTTKTKEGAIYLAADLALS